MFAALYELVLQRQRHASFFFHSYSCANEVRGRGWENGGLMYLVRGVALVIGGDTTRARVGERGWERRGTNIGDIHMQLLLRWQQKRRVEKNRCWPVTNVGVMSLWFISISALDWSELQFHMCELSKTPCLWGDKHLQHSLSTSLCFIISLDHSLGLHLDSEKVGV